MTDVILPGAEQLILSRPDGLGDHLLQIAPPVAPPGASPPPGGYPVLFVLDGAHLFATAFEALRLRALTAGLGPAVLVGLDYPGPVFEGFQRRVFDYTGPASLDPATAAMMPGARVGGAAGFLDFLLGEVWAAVAERFPVDVRARTLIGHSLGGLFAVNALLASLDAFSTVCALSPSLWWNDFETLHRARDAAARLAHGSASVLLTVGGEEQTPPRSAPPGMSLDAFAGRVRAWRMVEAMQELAAEFGRVDALEVRACVFDGEDHASVMPAALSRSLSFALGVWPAR